MICHEEEAAAARLLTCDVAVEELLPQLVGLPIERMDASPVMSRTTALTRNDVSQPCPGCGQVSGWTHPRYVRHVADEAVGGRPVVIDPSVQRLYCENPACPRATFVEQVDGLTERHQRRTPAPRRLVEAVAGALAGSAGARLPAVLHQTLSWATVLNCPMRIALPDRPPPVVAGIDEFALLKRHRYATIIIDADSGQRVDVLPDRRAATVTAWLREHPGVRVVCRDGSGAFA
ncbi:transposase [Streptomyces sp. NPDC044984]|uniref:transposase n=1 Tax=Streptomyces sp. NPDC044984 TaxID=3154335 RepID=UPI0034012036